MAWVAPFRDSNDYTQFSKSDGSGPSGLSTTIVYCSDSDGNNANDGRSSVPNVSGSGTGGVGGLPAGPKKTIHNEYTITTTGGPYTIVEGAEYQNNSQTFIVISYVGSTLKISGTGNPSSGAGTLTWSAGQASDTGVTFTGFTRTDGAWSVLNALGSGKPNWLLLRKGDTFRGSSFESGYQQGFNISGPTYNAAGNEPLILSSYDPANPNVCNPTTGGLRPIVAHPNQIFVTGVSLGGNNIAILGLNLTNSLQNPTYTNPVKEGRDGGGALIHRGAAIHYALVEDCDLNHGGWGYQPVGATNTNTYAGFGFDGQEIIRKSIIRRNIAQGIEGSIGGYNDSLTNNFIIEDCVLDSNGYWYYYRNEHATITAGSPGWINWNNVFTSRVDAAYTVRVKTTANGLTANTDYYVYNNDGTRFNLSATIGGPLITLTGANNDLYIFSTTYRSPDQAAGRNHNVYYGTVSRSDKESGAGKAFMRRNIFARDSQGTQFRTYGDYDNNCNVYGPQMTNMGTLKPSHTGNITNNVGIHFRNAEDNIGAIGAGGMDIGTDGYGHCYDGARGPINILNNIMTQGLDGGTAGYFIEIHPSPPAGGTGLTIGGNIMYKFGGGNSSGSSTSKFIEWQGGSGSGSTTRGGFHAKSSSPLSGVVTGAGILNAGSGYTTRTSNITSMRRAGMRQGYNGAASGNVVLTLANANNLAPDLVACEGGDLGVYITGISNGGGTDGGFAAAVNGQFFKVAAPNTDECGTNEIMLMESDSNIVPGTWASGGDVYAGYPSVGAVSNTGIGASGQYTIVPGPGGTVVGVLMFGREIVHGGTNPNSGGRDYAVNDQITHASTVGGGSGLVWKVPEIGSYTDNGDNIADFDGTGVIGSNPSLYPHPERTTLTYLAFLGISVPTNTPADFIDACIAGMDRHAGTFNKYLNAPSFNDYIRQGFGKTLIGSAYATDFGGGNSSWFTLRQVIGLHSA